MAPIPVRKDVSPKEGINEYGKVPFADPVNKKYPIDTEEHIRAAWNYIHKAENAAKYDGPALAAVKARIVSAWKSKIDKAGPPSAMNTTEPFNGPTLRKRVVISRAVGSFVNGSQSGVLSRKLLAGLVANFKKYPRQVPVYLLTGQPAPDQLHDPSYPSDLDERLADGWVEDLSLDGDNLMGELNLHGQAALAVQTDGVRGASIGTIPGSAYDGTDIGDVLEHVVLTNRPFVKGMNIAASLARGGERVACFYTALPKEAPVADPKDKNPDPAADPDAGGALNLQEEITGLQVVLAEKNGLIKDLEASNANLLEEVKAFKERPDLDLAQKRINQLERVNLAEKVRRLTAKLIADGQIAGDILRGWYDHDSDEVVLAGFKASQFKGNLALLEYHRASVKKNPGIRTFNSGNGGGDGETLTAEQKEIAEKAGKDPNVLAATAGAKNFSEWQARRKKAAGKE